MSETDLNEKLLEESGDDDHLNSKELNQDYQLLFTEAAEKYHNQENQEKGSIQQDKQHGVQPDNIFVSFSGMQNQDQYNHTQTFNPNSQNDKKKISATNTPTNVQSILKKKSSYESISLQGSGFDRPGHRTGSKKIDPNLKQSPNFSVIPEEIDNTHQQSQVRFGRAQERRFSAKDEIFKTDRTGSINKDEKQLNDEIQLDGEPGSVDENPQPKRHEIDYWKGELPLDLYLEGTYEGGQRTNLDALTVYRPDVDPKLYRHKNTDTYLHFDEKQYDYLTSVKEGRKRNMLRKINRDDGFLGFYSENKKNDVLKMLVCVTMYSESREFLENTLYHIYQNQKGFVNIGLKDFQIVVVVIQDGIMKMKEETVDFYSEVEGENRDPKRNLKLRRYEIQKQMDFLKFKGQESILDSNEGLPPTIPKRISLVYQNRLYFVKEREKDKKEKPKVYSSNNRNYTHNQAGMTVFSVFKHKNAKKLSSHMWFFEGFCRQFNPKYCALVDVGTLPAPDGLVKFYMAMESNKRIGGVCGFLGLEDPPQYREKINQQEIENLGLEQLIKERQHELENNSIWWNQWQQKKNQQQQKMIQNQLKEEQEFEQTEEKKQLEIKKQKHFKRKRMCYYIFSYIFLLPFKLLQIIFYIIYFIIFKIIIGSLFAILKWISLGYLSTLASLKKAQLYEYTMAHMLDKNFESLLGFLHVLPGAWSAYRYEALEIKYSHRQNLLQKRYFKQLVNPDQLEGNIQEANMFLAEDRILCLGIYCQPDSDFILKFIPDAKAFTDPVDTLEEFMNQRRRWINSTLYALDYVLKHYSHHVKESNHSSFNQKFLLNFNMLFAKIGELNTYFIPAFYFFVAITSSFQLLSPDIKAGSRFIGENGKAGKCGDYVPKHDELCEGKKKKENCYSQCSDSVFPSYIFSLFNFVPAIYIICFLLIVFASLTFKIKKINPAEVKEKLCRSLLTEEQKEDVKSRQEKIDTMQTEFNNSYNMSARQFRKGKEKIEKEKKNLSKHILKITKKQYKQMKENISQHSIKLSPKEKQFKNTYDSMASQDYANQTFKVLAAIMSFISIIVNLIVLLAIAMNVFNSSFGIVKGFIKLDDWLRIYIIIMVIVNSGSFFLLVFIHLLFQPSLVWYIIISYWSYIIYQPIYNFILIIFSFCNMDDVTWGTKGISADTNANIFYQGKVKFLIKWFSANALLLLAMIGGNIFSGKTPYLILLIGLYGTAYLAIKTFFAVLNYIKYFLFDKWVALIKIKWNKRKNNEKQKEMELKFKDFLHQIQSSKQKSQQEWGDLYNKNNLSSYESVSLLGMPSRNVSQYMSGPKQ